MSELESVNVEGPPPAAPRGKILLVYVGFYMSHDRQEQYAEYYAVTPDELRDGVLTSLDSQRRIYDWHSKNVRRFLRGSVGMVYEVECGGDEGSIFSDSARFVGRWPNETDSVRWAARHRTRLAEYEVDKARDKATKFDAVKNALDPVRAAYQALPGMQRQLFLAQIVDYLNRKG
jgi:hypothetical protein